MAEILRSIAFEEQGILLKEVLDDQEVVVSTKIQPTQPSRSTRAPNVPKWKGISPSNPRTSEMSASSQNKESSLARCSKLFAIRQRNTVNTLAISVPPIPYCT